MNRIAPADNKLLEKAGFEDADSEVPKRLILSISGHEKSGKSHFALTAPGPIAYIDLDRGQEGVVHKHMRDGKIIKTVRIKVPSIGPDKTVKKTVAVSAWERFCNAVDAAYNNRSIRTVIIDTGTQAWELIRLARFGRLSLEAHNYTPVNAEFREIILNPLPDLKVNVILLHRMKQEYVNKNWSGNYEPAQFKAMPFEVQANLYVERKKDVFSVLVENNRHNPECNGEVYSGFMCSFPQLAMQLMPDTELEDWE